MSELNRPSFKSSFETFQKAYDIDVNDLWNLTGKQSLSIIRNKIVHGQLIDRREKEYDAIICAKLHLKWILERCLLRLLGWEIERSRVKPSILKQFAGYDDWEEKKTLLKNW